jgi:hypothetical protein
MEGVHVSWGEGEIEWSFLGRKHKAFYMFLGEKVSTVLKASPAVL